MGGRRFSPDDKWLAYGSNESGPFEVYVGPFPDVMTAGAGIAEAAAPSQCGHETAASCSIIDVRRLFC